MMLPADPDVIVLADVARVTDREPTALTDWVEDGGLLLRFAGPRLAASDVSGEVEDPLMPVRLRDGGRAVGGAMSWGEPKALRPFDEASPFYGLAVPDEVTVTARCWRSPTRNWPTAPSPALADGTPLVTRKARRARGRWCCSTSPPTPNGPRCRCPGCSCRCWSGWPSPRAGGLRRSRALAGTTWTPREVLDGFGAARPLPSVVAGRAGRRLAAAQASARTCRRASMPATDRRVALNVIGPDDRLRPAAWPADVPVEGLAVPRRPGSRAASLPWCCWRSTARDPPRLGLLGRRLRGARARRRRGRSGAGAGDSAAPDARAHEAAPDDRRALEATTAEVLAHVLTGDAQVDEIAQAGLTGLCQTLYDRTSIEPGEPIGVDLETDELAFFPFLYWPITATSRSPRPRPMPTSTLTCATAG